MTAPDRLPVFGVGVKEAAAALGVGPDRIRDLVNDGTIATIPTLSTRTKIVIAVAELERIARAGVKADAT